MCTYCITLALLATYCLMFIVSPAGFVSPRIARWMGMPAAWLRDLSAALCDAFSWSSRGAGGNLHVEAVYLVLVGGVIPWAVLCAAKHGRPQQLGFRFPNRLAWKYCFIGLAFAAPFLWWMVNGRRFAAEYLPRLRSVGIELFIGYYVINMLVEHFFLHGIVLAVLRPGHGWPPPTAVVPGGRQGVALRFLRWLGLAQPRRGARGVRRITHWFGLQPGCWWAIVGSGLLFGLVHANKNVRELILSFPGGWAMAYIAYRSNSWLTPWLLHALTAAAALVMLLWIHVFR